MNKNNIISWNCDGFYSHFNEFQLICQDFNPIFFGVQETKFKFDQKIGKLEKFNAFTKNFQTATNVAQGGVLILQTYKQLPRKCIFQSNLFCAACTFQIPEILPKMK